MARVASLHIYPIKSLGGFEVDSSFIERRGLREDRRMMLVDANGHFLTQRTKERMALFRVSPIPGGYLVHAPDQNTLEIGPEFLSTTMPVKVWSSELDAHRVSPAADAWFSDHMGETVHLVRMTDDIVRPTSAEYRNPGDHVSFADGFPILAISQASLADLNGRLEHPVPMDRFRPNVVLTDCDAFDEDTWPRVQIGATIIRFTKKCGRCKVTTINQETAEISKEPLRTLATYRMEGNAVMFGANWTPEGEGPIRIGDLVEPLT